jgi:hypothetical protein
LDGAGCNAACPKTLPCRVDPNYGHTIASARDEMLYAERSTEYFKRDGLKTLTGASPDSIRGQCGLASVAHQGHYFEPYHDHQGKNRLPCYLVNLGLIALVAAETMLGALRKRLRLKTTGRFIFMMIMTVL